MMMMVEIMLASKKTLPKEAQAATGNPIRVPRQPPAPDAGLHQLRLCGLLLR
jgi:hypothetical protein